MLVNIKKPNFNVEVDLAYATTNNFSHKIQYKNPHCYLHKDAAKLLKKAIELAKPLGYSLKIFDAFRPLEVQEAFWAHTPDENFLSNPKTGSVPHCRGVAVDLTLIRTDSGQELDMGTEFDHFSPLSFHCSTDISLEAQRNRFLLLGIMTAAGWDFFRNEWWHYQLFNPRNYDILSDKKEKTNML